MAAYQISTAELVQVVKDTGIPIEYIDLCRVITNKSAKSPYTYEVCGVLLASKDTLGAPWESRYTLEQLVHITHNLINWEIQKREDKSKGHVTSEEIRACNAELEEDFEAAPVPPTPKKVLGVKYDSDKPSPRLLHVSLPRAVESIVKVLSYGAKKYSPDNWKHVEAERYEDALYRHLSAHHLGELLDAETGEPHLTAAITNILFLLEKTLEARG